MLEAYRIVSLQGDDGFLTISHSTPPVSLFFSHSPPPSHTPQQAKKKKGDLSETRGIIKKN